MSECCFFSRGKAFISDRLDKCGWGNNWGLAFGGEGCDIPKNYTELGNITSLEINIDAEFVIANGYQGKIFNTPNCAGVVVNNIGLNMELACTDWENINKAFLGKRTNHNTSGSITDNIIAYSGSYPSKTFFHFSKLNPTDGTVVLNIVDEDLNVISTLVEGTDYFYENDGITLILALDLPVNRMLTLSYDYVDTSEEIQTLIEDIGPRSLLFRGTNYADDGYDYSIEIFRSKFLPVSAFNTIDTDAFKTLLLEGIALKKLGNSDDNISQYMTVKRYTRKVEP